VPNSLDEARGIDTLNLKETGDLLTERVIAHDAGEMACKPPAGKGYKGRGNRPAALDDHTAEFTFRVGGRPGGNAPDGVEGTLAEAKDVHGLTWGLEY
jgi:hypothetical protein